MTMTSKSRIHSLFVSFADILAWFGAFLFLSGGFKFYLSFTKSPQMIEVNQWGLCFIPLALLALLNGRQVAKLTFSRFLLFLWPKLASHRVAASACLIIGVLHFLALYSRHLSFNSNWDLAIYANACANNLHSSLRNNLSLLADHFEPGLAIMTPLCRITDPAISLLASQIVIWCIGACGVYKLALTMKWGHSFATIALVLYLLFSGHQTISYYDFHLYGWALGTIPWIMYAIQTRRNFLFAALVFAHLLLKENTGLFIAGLGAWLFLNGRKSTGIFTIVTGGVVFILVMKLVFPYFRNGVESEYFAKYYGYIGRNLSEFIHTAVIRPWIPLQQLLTLPRLSYYAMLLMPFMILPLLAPSYLLPVTGALLINALSSADFIYTGGYHYEAEIYPWFFASTIVLLQEKKIALRWQLLTKFSTRMQTWNLKLIWVTVMIIGFSGVSPFGRIAYYSANKLQAELHTQLRTLTRQLKDCKVATVDRVTPHMSEVPQLYTMDRVQDANAVVVAYPQGDRLWMTSVEKIENELAPLLNASFTLVRPLNYDANFRVWTKNPCKLKN